MAAMSIASASSGGKSAFDRAAILRKAHADTRGHVAKYRAAGTMEAAGVTYRKTFANMLRHAWQSAKDRAIDEAAASLPVADDVAQRIRDIEMEAWLSPINSRGNEEYTALMRKASQLREKVRKASRAPRPLFEMAAEPTDQNAFDFAGLTPPTCAVAAHV